jgi:hypothetical protein
MEPGKARRDSDNGSPWSQVSQAGTQLAAHHPSPSFSVPVRDAMNSEVTYLGDSVLFVSSIRQDRLLRRVFYSATLAPCDARSGSAEHTVPCLPKRETTSALPDEERRVPLQADQGVERLTMSVESSSLSISDTCPPPQTLRLYPRHLTPTF